MHLCTHASLHGTQHTSFGCSCRSSRFLETLRECPFASPASVAADWPPVSATARSKELRRPDTCARVSVMAKSSRACACTRARRTMVLRPTMCCMVLKPTMVCRTVDSAVCAFRSGPASRHDNSAGGGGGYSLRYPIYIWDIQIGYRFPGPPYAIVFAYTDTCETLGRSGRTLRVILSGKSELGNLIRAQQRSRRALAARWHCVGGAVAATMAGSWWDSP